MVLKVRHRVDVGCETRRVDRSIEDVLRIRTWVIQYNKTTTHNTTIHTHTREKGQGRTRHKSKIILPGDGA